jgi:hypothetical protein
VGRAGHGIVRSRSMEAVAKAALVVFPSASAALIGQHRGAALWCHIADR